MGILNFFTPFGTAQISGGILPGSDPSDVVRAPAPLPNEPGAGLSAKSVPAPPPPPVQPGLSAPSNEVASTPPAAGLSSPLWKPMTVSPVDNKRVLMPAGGDATSKAHNVYNFYRGRGWDDIHAKAITGRLLQESWTKNGPFDPYAEGDKNLGVPSRGIGQFRAERWTGMEAYAASQPGDKSPYNVTNQLSYFDDTLRHGLPTRPDLKRVGKEFENATTLDEALHSLRKFQGSIEDTDKVLEKLRRVGLI